MSTYQTNFIDNFISKTYDMTLVQLEYLIALDTYRQLTIAAEKSHISQPALTMQLQKLEEELGVKLFDRSKQPVMPTEIGQVVIGQARAVLQESQRITDIVQTYKQEISGEIRVGIIPTLAPYLLPLFLAQFLKKFPLVKLRVRELPTDTLVQLLKAGQLDVGIAITPLGDDRLYEQRLFYEEFVVYVAAEDHHHDKQFVLAEDIEADQLWLLEEGHCMRSQIMNLCELRKQRLDGQQFYYEAGSIEGLKRMVDRYGGLTVLPELATTDMSATQQAQLRQFARPAPVREVSLITHRNYVKQSLIDALKAEILRAVPARMQQPGVGVVVGTG
jgi:LysR family transcriptional regulator, hydrogen peroxide-inducible genes activator